MTTLEFEVDSINKQGLVLGRNGNVDIPVGFTFTSIRKVRIDGPTSDLQAVSMGTVASIKLRLEEVHFYRRTVEFIPGGHTAGLRVSGDGLNELRVALLQRGSREYLHLSGSGDGAQPTLQADAATQRGLS